MQSNNYNGIWRLPFLCSCVDRVDVAGLIVKSRDSMAGSSISAQPETNTNKRGTVVAISCTGDLQDFPGPYLNPT